MPGGQIPADNRPSQAPGVGKNAKRHDLERQKVIPYQDSELQQGDVSMYAQGISVAPTNSPTVQAPARPQTPTPSSGGSPQPAPQGVPDPMAFMADRYGGTLSGVPSDVQMRPIDVTPWMGLLRQVANSPTSSSPLQQAFIRQLRNTMRRPMIPDITTVDLNDLDTAVAVYLDNLEE
jgi:hypothetical protein